MLYGFNIVVVAILNCRWTRLHW